MEFEDNFTWTEDNFTWIEDSTTLEEFVGDGAYSSGNFNMEITSMKREYKRLQERQ